MTTITGIEPKPKLSIVIPTRNRQQYLLDLVKSLYALHNDPSVEIIVADNSSSTLSADAVSLFHGISNLQYVYREEQMDMISNFNQGTQLAKGRYITFLGDDDTLNPEITDLVEWAEQNDLDAVTPSRPVQYYWPDYTSKWWGKSWAGRLIWKRFSGKVTEPDVTKELTRCVKSAAIDFYRAKLPRVYYGIVKRDLLDRIYALTGSYFPGPSPDVAGAIAVSTLVDTFVHIDYPIFLPGAAAGSGAGLGARKQHKGDLNSFSHLPQRYLIEWPKIVPHVFTGPSIWAADVIIALLSMKKRELIKQINIPYLIAACITEYPATIHQNIRLLLHDANYGLMEGYFKILFSFVRILFKRFRALCSNILYFLHLTRDQTDLNVNSTVDAVQILLVNLQKKGISLKKILASYRNTRTTSGIENLPRQ